MKIKNLDELIGKIVVVTADYGTGGYMIAQRHLDCRRLGAVGEVTGWVPGHGGDVVWVQHPDETVGAYCHVTELEFFSEGAVLFGQNKAVAVMAAEKALKELKESRYEE